MKKNLLVVDDSALMRRVICDIINEDGNYEVKDSCRNGKEALEKLRKIQYDGVLLDVNMPVMDGLQLLEMLQKENIQATIIMVSTLTKKDADVTIRAMELGALDFVTKPENVMDCKGDDFKEKLLNILKTVSNVNSKPMSMGVTARPTGRATGSSITSRPTSRPTTNTRPVSKPTQSEEPVKISESIPSATGKKLIALASSTGGPKALQSVIPKLPKNMDAPLVLVQHMPAGFTASMAKRLDELSQVTVKEAEDGDVLRKGVVYVAPGGKHIHVEPSGSDHKIRLSDEEPIGGLKPCADVMYESLKNSKFDNIACVVLTGMGADGTKGINSLKKSGKKIYTIAQNAETCVVYGMPKAIAESGVVDQVVPLEAVAGTIIKNVGVV